MAMEIQFRRGTAAQWTASNPTLAEGELGLETDTRKIKVGDGTTAWTSLDYNLVGMKGDKGDTGATGAAGADGTNYLTQSQATDLTDGGATTLHKHSYSNLDDKPTLGTASAQDTSAFAPALGADDNYVTDTEKSNLHAPGSDNQDLSGLIAKTTNITALNETGIADGEIAVFNLTNKDIRTSDKVFSIDGSLAGNSDSNIPTEKAVKTYCDQLIGAANAVVYKGVIDCATNPNYPAADAGHIYFVSVAGKLGGSSGVSVEIGDMALCNTDGTSAGDQATVGTKWNVLQKNIADYIIGPSSVTDATIPLFDGVTGKLLKGSAYTPASFAAALGADDNYVTDAEKTKIGTVESNADVTDAGNVGSSINGSSAKTSMVDADKVAIIDTEASNALKTLSWAYVKSILKAYFDTLYNKYVHPNHSGDVTSVADGAQTIAAKAVTYAKIQDISATAKVLGRVSSGSGAIEEIAIDDDLSSTSANDDTVPSAKATKAMGDLKLPLAGGTMTGNITLSEETSIILDAAGSADEKWSGITVSGTAGATVAVGDLIYLDVTATEWLLADADAAATAGDVPLGISLTAANDGGTISILLFGTIRSAAFPASIALGAPVYVSTTAGDIQAAQPTGTDDVIRRVGWAVSAEPNTIFFNPSNDYLIHT